MDLSQITNIDTLKARAFDTIQNIEIQQANLRALQQRIAQVQSDARKKALQGEEEKEVHKEEKRSGETSKSENKKA